MFIIQEIISFFGESLIFFIVPYYLFFIVMRITFNEDVDWCIFDYADLYLPVIIWLPICILNQNNKSPINIMAEPYIIAIIAIILLIIRIICGKKINKYKISIILLSLLCLCSILIGLIFPYIPC